MFPVPAASPPPQRASGERPPRAFVYSLEAAGILVIGTLVLVFIIARYWHHVAWSAR